MKKEESEVYWEGQAFPLGVVNPEPRQGMGITRNELETASCNCLEPQGACITGADDLPTRDFEQMTMLGGKLGTTKLTTLFRCWNFAWTREATQ